MFDHFVRFWAKDDDPGLEMAVGKGATEEQAGMDLYDNVTAAIYEDDIMEIAVNALGGDLHQDHRGEWAPADAFVVVEEKPHPVKKASPATSPTSSLESSILGTIKDLYDAHKSDVSCGTLGNFTFIQMIEQLGRLLPDGIRQKTEEQASWAKGRVKGSL